MAHVAEADETDVHDTPPLHSARMVPVQLEFPFVSRLFDMKASLATEEKEL
jgi:hypothetical protein